MQKLSIVIPMYYEEEVAAWEIGYNLGKVFNFNKKDMQMKNKHIQIYTT